MADPYEYVRRTYGVSPVVGHRARHRDSEGIIVAPRSAAHYVHVRFDGCKFAERFHPEDPDLVYLGRVHLAVDLERLIALVDAKIEAVGPAPTFDVYDRLVHQSYFDSLGRVIAELEQGEKAKYRASVAGADELSLGGVKTSCTSGKAGLLRNWKKAAQRRVGEIKAEAATL